MKNTIDLPEAFVPPKHGSLEKLEAFLEEARGGLRADTVRPRRPSFFPSGLQWLFLGLVSLVLVTGVLMETSDEVAAWWAVFSWR